LYHNTRHKKHRIAQANYEGLKKSNETNQLLTYVGDETLFGENTHNTKKKRKLWSAYSREVGLEITLRKLNIYSYLTDCTQDKVTM